MNPVFAVLELGAAVFFVAAAWLALRRGRLPFLELISAATFGKAAPTNCGWFVQIKDGKFVLFPTNGKPWKGKLIESSTVATTTTTAAGQ